MSGVKKHRLRPIEYDEVSLVDSGAAQDAHVLIIKRKTPCGGEVPSNKTGAKDGKSERSKKWKEERHKRKADGTYDKTSQASKEKYGKDGTTAANRGCGTSKGDAKKKPETNGDKNALQTARGILRNRDKNRKKKRRQVEENLRDAQKAARRRKNDRVEKSTTTWADDARVRAILERKAT